MTSRDVTWSPAQPSRDRSLGRTIAGIVLAWFVVVLAAGSRDAFVAGPSAPPLPLLVAILGPPLAFAIAYHSWDRFRAFVLGIDLRMLTAVQTWRVIGSMFLALYAFGLLPGLFAWPAGVGDVAVGVAAVFVLRAMITGAPDWRRRVWWLNVGGLLDFAAAIGTGVLTSNTALGIFATGTPRADMGALPLALIPAFAVPLWIVFHLMSLLQLRELDARR